ncbi:YiiD C-terminal domain-containing protein [Marinicellulosiphila megalodicopiae]|uniref:YiiD C-terminal domain-containing protein n=1 Tax=Marinicellulosiphila megalodicopiae TaxID=2724896 RepID=UPI003BB09BE5
MIPTQFETWQKQIPMIDLMGVKPLYTSEYVLENQVKFEPNENEKHSVLGGSLTSACALSGWMICSGSFEKSSVSIIKQDSEFTAPVSRDFIVRVTVSPDELDVVKQKMQVRGRSSMKVTAQVFEVGSPTVAMQANMVYVIEKFKN